MKRKKLPVAIPVPGGFVTTRLSKGPLSLVMSAVGAGVADDPNAVLQDVVIEDEWGERILYREGPYNSIRVQSALREVLSEVRREGLDEFLRAKQIEGGRIGPVIARPRPGGTAGIWEYLVAWASVKLHRRRSK